MTGAGARPAAAAEASRQQDILPVYRPGSRMPEAPQAAPRPRRALSRAEVEQLLTREDISLCERTLWRMLYELLAQPSRRHHAAGAVRVLAQSLTDIPGA